MEWRDEGVVIGLKRLGESSSVLEAMTRAHGRHLGARARRPLEPARGGAAARQHASAWSGARGSTSTSAPSPSSRSTLRAGRFLPSAMALAGLNLIGALLRLLPERDPHESLFEALTVVVEALDDPALAPALLARFEARMLRGMRLRARFLGMRGDRRARGSDLRVAEIGARGQRARRARRIATACCRCRRSCATAALAPTPDDIADAFRLTGYFLERELFAPRGLKLPEARETVVAAMRRARG